MPETPREFYPTQWGPRSGSFGPPECEAIPAPVARSASQSARRTTPQQEDGPRRGRQEGTASGYSSPKSNLRQLFAVRLQTRLGGPSLDRRRQHYNVRVVRQSQALHRLLRIQSELVLVQIEGPLVLGSVVEVAIGHRNTFRLVRVFLRREPVAEVLHDFRSRPVGIGDGERLRCLASLDTCGKQHQARIFSRRESNSLPLAAHCIDDVRRAQFEKNAIENS